MTTTRRTSSLSMMALAAAIGWLAPTARAAPAPAPSSSDDARLEAAKHHFQQGAVLYNHQNFNGALAEFLAAYQSRPSPAVLYNIGLTQKALFRYNDSIQSLERYLTEETGLTAERRAEVKQLIGEMRALLADVTFDIAPDG